LGRRYTPGNGEYFYFNGGVAELLVFNRTLTGDEKVAVGNYLELKYNLSQYATNALPPGTPTNLTAIGVAPYQLNLQWVRTSTNETAFDIERKLGSGGIYQEIAIVLSGVTNFLDTPTSLTNQYFYRIRALNYFGASAYSSEISPPVAIITNPPPQSFFSMGTNVTLNATTADFYGTVTQINYWINNTLYLTATNTSYTGILTNLAVGVYNVTAQPMDNLGNSSFSASVSFEVSPDTDGDGINDFQEILMGTDPTNPLDPGPWTPPSSSTAPTIILIEPGNAVLLP
jgi:hypothetical protein